MTPHPALQQIKKMDRNVGSFLASNARLYRSQFIIENNGILPVGLFLVKQTDRQTSEVNQTVGIGRVSTFF